MAINDVEYIKGNKIINEQKKRQHQIFPKYLGKDYRKTRNDIIVFYNYDLSKDEHSYENYKSSFKRLIEKHKESIYLYKKNHPGYKLIFYMFDESIEYYDQVNEKLMVHICFNDKNFVDIKKLDVEYVVWVSHLKYIERQNNKEIKIPRIAIYEIKELHKYKFIDYSNFNLKPNN